MKKEEAYRVLKSGGTLFTPTWYITMPTDSEQIFATCGYDDCCDNSWENFEEFWDFHKDSDLVEK